MARPAFFAYISLLANEVNEEDQYLHYLREVHPSD
jgi:hypothetical protein